jgi:nucleotide-binding universal stress UspA family protein
MARLFVCLDGSESSVHALEHAIKRAKEDTASTLHLVTALPKPVVYGEIEVYVTQERMAELQRQHGEDLLKPAQELAEKSGVGFTSEILVGDIAPALAKRAAELQCDEIVMGTRGMSAIGNLVMGSVATKVVHWAVVPVTLVK